MTDMPRNNRPVVSRPKRRPSVLVDDVERARCILGWPLAPGPSHRWQLRAAWHEPRAMNELSILSVMTRGRIGVAATRYWQAFVSRPVFALVTFTMYSSAV